MIIYRFLLHLYISQTLSKKYEVSPDLLDDKAPALSECSGTDIEWKTGKDLTVTETVKKQKAKSGKNKGQVKTVVTSAPKPSFFHYFAMPMTEEEEVRDVGTVRTLSQCLHGTTPF